jgi:hypothetical protein
MYSAVPSLPPLTGVSTPDHVALAQGPEGHAATPTMNSRRRFILDPSRMIGGSLSWSGVSGNWLRSKLLQHVG